MSVAVTSARLGVVKYSSGILYVAGGGAESAMGTDGSARPPTRLIPSWKCARAFMRNFKNLSLLSQFTSFLMLFDFIPQSLCGNATRQETFP